MTAGRSQEVDAYIAGFPESTAVALEQLRTAVHDAVPGTGEGMRYDMPVVTLGDGYLVHFAGWKHHLALYPVPRVAEPLESKVSPLRSGKDTVKFMLDRPVPTELVARIAAAIVEVRERSGAT
jgi:uncharacterized protein YdhG (YjbR/CyaY superfamily)